MDAFRNLGHELRNRILVGVGDARSLERMAAVSKAWQADLADEFGAPWRAAVVSEVGPDFDIPPTLNLRQFAATLSNLPRRMTGLQYAAAVAAARANPRSPPVLPGRFDWDLYHSRPQECRACDFCHVGPLDLFHFLIEIAVGERVLFFTIIHPRSPVDAPQVQFRSLERRGFYFQLPECPDSIWDGIDEVDLTVNAWALRVDDGRSMGLLHRPGGSRERSAEEKAADSFPEEG